MWRGGWLPLFCLVVACAPRAREPTRTAARDTTARDACLREHWPITPCARPTAAELVGLWHLFDLETGRMIPDGALLFDGCSATSVWAPCPPQVRACAEEYERHGVPRQNPYAFYTMTTEWDGTVLRWRSRYEPRAQPLAHVVDGRVHPGDGHAPPGAEYRRMTSADELDEWDLRLLCEATPLEE